MLANEQVVQGVCERCDTPVTTRRLGQWFLRITEYADRLLANLEKLPGWPERVRLCRKTGSGVRRGGDPLSHQGLGSELAVFTTRPDTLFGVTYMVIAPEHEIGRPIDRRTAQDEDEIRAFIERVKRQDEIDTNIGGAGERRVSLRGRTPSTP